MVVALHTEGVDRNRSKLLQIPRLQAVALHTEGVDRNGYGGQSLDI